MSRLRMLPPPSSLVTDASYAFLDPRIRSGGPGAVLAVGRERCLPRYTVDRPGYVSFAVEFVAEGRGRLQLGGAWHRLQPGHVFAYGPGIAHRITTETGSPMLKYFANFSGERREWFDRRGVQPGRLLWTGEVGPLRRLFEDLIRECRAIRRARAVLARDYLRLIVHKAGAGYVGATGRASRSVDAYWRCRRVMEEHFAELPTLADVARKAGLSASHVCRLFGRMQEGSPYGFLVRRKMEAAAELLAAGAGSCLVKQAALAVGYEDALHFSKVFRRQFGCSPSEFQRLHGRT